MFYKRVTKRIIIVIGCLFFCITQSLAQSNSDDDTNVFKSLINAAGASIYFAAWPTATYKRLTFEDAEMSSEGALFKIKLHGISAFSETSLWTEAFLRIQNGKITDFHWGRNNAFLAQPGETASFLGDLIKDINKQHFNNSNSRQQPLVSNLSNGFKFKLTNDCRHPIKLAIRYKKMDDTWTSIAWWEFAGNTASYLQLRDGTYITSKSTKSYYYAQAMDGTFEWTGDGTHSFKVNGAELAMRELIDKQGDTNWSLNCDGR